jgi:hypothetical protein
MHFRYANYDIVLLPLMHFRYAVFETALFVRKADEMGPNVIDIHRSKEADGASPMMRNGVDGPPVLPIYRVFVSGVR